MLLTNAAAFFSGASFVAARCFDPSPGFPVPEWRESGPTIPSSVFASIEKALYDEIGQDLLNSSSFSLEVTSDTNTLWTYYHTGKEHDPERPGVTKVDGTSQYRIASITKTFTTLGILHQYAAGNLSLDNSVTEYIPELNEPSTGDIPFHEITLRNLATQLSGIPREFALGDLIFELPDPTVIGLPPATAEKLPACYREQRPCNGTDLIEQLNKQHPLFAPHQQSTYGNDNFNLLGLVLENVTGMPYSDYIQTAILDPLNMTFATLEKPSDEHAVLPKNSWYWDVEEGVQRPTGGMYAGASDMSKFLRYVLTHYNAIAPGVNWLFPASWSGGLNNFYGMPWEIFRTDRILLPESRRPVTYATKSGGLPSYYSIITVMQEYGLGITVLVAGDLVLKGKLQEIVTKHLTKAAEAAVWENIDKTHTGSYVATNASLNSSISFTASSTTGVIMTSFISNGTDVFSTLLPQLAGPILDEGWRAQLVPTMLYKNQTAQRGEIWRLLVVSERPDDIEGGEICLTDVDPASYGGLPLNEVVFWLEEGLVELPAWKVMFKAVEEGNKFVVQDLWDFIPSLRRADQGR